MLAEYRRSGQTQESFARSQGVSVAAMRNWLYRRTGSTAAPARAKARGVGNGFVPVRLIGEPNPPNAGGVPAAAMPQLVVRWPQGASVELHVAPSTPGVAELIGSLLGLCSR
jgi:hypothetical protein